MSRFEHHHIHGLLSADEDVRDALSVFSDRAQQGLLHDVAAQFVKESSKPAFNAMWTASILRGVLERSVVGGMLSDKTQSHLTNIMGRVVQPFLLKQTDSQEKP